MERKEFEDIVIEVIETLPTEFKDLIDNVNIIVEDWPTKDQLRSVHINHKNNLLGLYEGIPNTERGHNYNLVLPDRITIFQKPLEAICHSRRELKNKIASTVKHEIAHFFGTDEATLYEIEKRGGR